VTVPATVWLAGKLEMETLEIDRAGIVVTATDTALARSSALVRPPAAVTLIAGIVTTFTLTTLATVTVLTITLATTGWLKVTTLGVSVSDK
jgi:hypothetical protein